MIILGIDPGVARLGWAVMDATSSPRPLAYGCITTEKTEKLPDRLRQLYEALNIILERYHPDVMSIEDLFFSKNAKTAISVGEARGIVLLAAAKQNMGVVSYSPLTVKRAICGDGSADKKQIGKMVTQILKLKEIPKPDDTADAIAIALTHAYSYRLKGKIV